jgi:transcription elongation factor GreA
MNKAPLTKAGEAKLRAALQTHKTTDRQRLRVALNEALAHGDLKENAEYHAAKDEQGLLEAKIRYIESQLQSCTVIDVLQFKTLDKIMFGATVTLKNLETEKNMVIQLVGESETELENGKISYKSPIAQACISQKQGDFIEVKTPSGNDSYEIISIKYI